VSSNQRRCWRWCNVGAYATEIVRAGIESIGRGQIEAASRSA